MNLSRVDEFKSETRTHRIGDVIGFRFKAFGTGVVTRIDVDRDSPMEAYVTICRPYLYAGAWSGCSPLVGYETVGGISVKSLEQHYDLLDTGKVSS